MPENLRRMKRTALLRHCKRLKRDILRKINLGPASPAMLEMWEQMVVTGKRAVVSSVTVVLILFGAASGAMAGSERWPRGGFVKACSLDGVNPVHHPSIFGNPAVARSYGFVQLRDRTWHVISDCHIY
jgi:hypothetical protein